MGTKLSLTVAFALGLVVVALPSDADAAFITITNTGNNPIVAVVLSFDLEPLGPIPSGIPDFQLFSERGATDPTNIFFPLFNEANPLLPGESLDTFLIPQLTGLDFRLFVASLGGFGMGLTESFTNTTPVVLDNTVDNVGNDPMFLTASLVYRSGGVLAPETGAVPEPSTFALWSLGAVVFVRCGWRRRTRAV
jgi:hypothetical protein